LSMIGKELQGGMFCTYFALNNYARIHYCLWPLEHPKNPTKLCLGCRECQKRGSITRSN
jgi:hypothetical protein